MLILTILDYLGTFAFAVSGALKAARRDMDVFGLSVLAVVTAIGGGTIRDVMLGQQPFWFRDANYVLLSLAAALLMFALYRLVARGETLLLVFDAVGQVILPTDYNPEKHYGMNIDRPHCALLTDLFGSGHPQMLLGTDKYLYAFWAHGPNAATSGVRRTGCHLHLTSWQPATGFPWVYGATDMGAVIAYRCAAAPKNEWIGLETQWCQVVGDKVTALAVGKLGGQEVVWVGTKRGRAWAMEAVTGRVVGQCEAAPAAVASLIATGEGVLAATADGTVAKLTTP